MSSDTKSVENKLLSVNLDDIESFIKIMDELTESEKKLLGNKLDTWKISCLYHFLLSANVNTNLFINAPQIIRKFKEMESNIIHKNGKIKINKELLKMMYAGTKDKKYLEYLKDDIIDVV